MTETNFLFDVEALTAKNSREKAREVISPAARGMLLLLAELDTNKEIIAALLELHDMEIGHIRYIAAPVIVHRGAWADTVPAWIFKAIAIDRLKLVFEEHEKGIVGHLVTPAEIVAVMMPASYEAPMGTRWTNLYLWACNEAIVAHNRLRDGVKDTWELLGMPPIQYASIKHDYEELARDIRHRLVEASRARGWKKRAKDPLESKAKKPTEIAEIEGQLNILELSTDEIDSGDVPAPPPRVEQTNLFDLLG
jgi:hypothetical protein